MTAFSWVIVAALAGGATGQPQMCKEYLYEFACLDAGCRWRGATGTCTRQCHEFGGAVKPGTPESRIECTGPAVGCRVIEHPTNAGVWKCGKLCAEFKIESNCQLAGYSTCRWAHGDITGGPPQCTKMCNAITDPDWCGTAHCVWLPETGSCRRKCIEFEMPAPCNSIPGCTWVTPDEGYPLSQCIPAGQQLPAPAGAGFVNQTSVSSNGTFFAEGQTFKLPTKWPTKAKTNGTKDKQFLQMVEKH